MRGLQVAPRTERLRGRFDEARLDALVVTNLQNVRYLTGFTGSAALLALTRTGALLTTDGRYRTQSAEEVAAAGAPVEIFVGALGAQRDAVKAFVSNAMHVGLEADHVSWSDSRLWGELIGEIVPTTGLVEALREIKDEGEIDRVAEAARIADTAMEEVLAMLSSGVSELALALALDTAMRRNGAESPAFETIVASGPNSAKPHHRPTHRSIGRGEPVVVDFGATFEGYRSDMTRTFFARGEPEGELAKIYAVVRDAQARGVAAVAPGVGCKEVDEVCRSVIGEAGWADRFEHGTGHGVGLDIHEAPTLSPLGTATLAPGMIVTVEPGVYLPGVGGVRIEDTLVVTEDGNRALTSFAKTAAV